MKSHLQHCEVSSSLSMFHFITDELKWLKRTSDKDLAFYTGRGGLNETCALHEDALKFTFRKLGIFVDYDCDCARRAVMQVDVYNFISETFSWLFWSNDIHPDQLESLDLPLQLYNEVKFALHDGDYFKIYDVYRIYDDTPAISILAGSWNISNGIVWDMALDKYRRRRDFQNITLKAGLTIVDYNSSDPNLFETLKNPNKDKGKEALSRQVPHVCEHLQDIHNFRVNITISNEFGYAKQADGIYGGLLGDLQTHKIDVALTGLAMLNFRLDVADFNNLPVWPFRNCFIFLQPRVLESSTLLIYPFSREVWYTSFLVMLLASFLIYIVATYDHSLRFSIGSAVLYFTGILSQQGAVLNSKWISGRFLLLTSLIFGYFLFYYYSGQVVSELLAPTPSTISTSRQLLDSPLLLAADAFTPYLRVRHKIEKAHNIPELGKKMEETGGFISLVEGIQKVKGSLYAFITEDNKGYDLIDRTYSPAEICALGEICLPVVEIFLLFKRYSPQKEAFSISVIMMNERGVLKRLITLWRQPKPQCTGHIDIHAVDLENATVAFYILLSGAATGCFAFLVENLVAKRKLIWGRH